MFNKLLASFKLFASADAKIYPAVLHCIAEVKAVLHIFVLPPENRAQLGQNLFSQLTAISGDDWCRCPTHK